MATTTENIGLTKPAETDYYDVGVFNTNADLIDAAVGEKANKVSPTFTGTPKAPTAPAGTNSTQIATTEFVQTLVDDLKGSVSDGKSAVASAITDKGVSTSSSATFATMAANIRAINTGPADGLKFEQIEFELPSNEYFHGVAYGASHFIAFSATKIYQSLTGLDWTCVYEYTQTGSEYFNCIAYGKGVFIIVAGTNGSNVIVTSSDDGATWEKKTLPSSGHWEGIAYGEGIFVITDGSYILYSTDSINWTEVGLFSTNGRNIAYGMGLFVITTSFGRNVAYSEDGINWTKIDDALSSNMWLSNVAYGNGTFVALASTGTSNSRGAIWSTDGINWTKVSTPSRIAKREAVTYGNGKFICVSGNYISWSQDGKTWNEEQSSIQFDNYRSRIAYGKGMFVVVSNHNIAISRTTNVA